MAKIEVTIGATLSVAAVRLSTNQFGYYRLCHRSGLFLAAERVPKPELALVQPPRNHPKLQL
jgi:hypothetical protein